MSIRNRVSSLFNRKHNKDKAEAYRIYNTFNQFWEVLNRISMPNMGFYLSLPAVTPTDTLSFYMQVKCDGVYNVTGTSQRWSGRKWMLSEHMTDQEIVQTALKTVLTAYEHEIREQFKYRGVTVFDPHYDIEKLVELRSQADSVVQRQSKDKPRLQASPGVMKG